MMGNTTIELTDLVGRHTLSGVDMLKHKSICNYIKEHFEDKSYLITNNVYAYSVINFVLDGKTITATEDPIDDLRSVLGVLFVTETQLSNTFKGIEVDATYHEDEMRKLLTFSDIVNSEPVLKIGTDSSDDYYPIAIMEFIPENMHINKL